MADSTVPPTTLDLAWKGGIRFTGRSEGADLTFDGPGNPTPTPVQALAGSLAACMGIDLVQILGKGRHEVLELRVHLSGDRREEFPRYFTAIRLHFTLRGAIPPEAVERAIQLSRDSYCSVWHSLRQDIALTTTFELLPPAKA
jgi:putative redox protein